MVTLDDVVEAQRAIAGRLHRTPLLSAHALGAMAEPRVNLFLKAELLQKTGAFKVRGALNKLAGLSSEQKRRGLITVSAGNHAQAVAWSAAAEGVPATVVMAETAVRSKVNATRGYGAEVILFGTSMAGIFDHAHQLERERGLLFIPPFDDPRIVAGQGTIGLEILEDLPDPDVVIVPCGGGGLCSGVAVAIKSRRPQTRVVIVEPQGAPTMRRSLDAGKPVALETINTIADGLTAPFTSDLTLSMTQQYVDDAVLVSDAEISRAMGLILERCKLLAEPAAAASVAALLSGKVNAAEGANVVAILSGGNVDRERLKQLL
jgi:threonine dehydratase